MIDQLKDQIRNNKNNKKPDALDLIYLSNTPAKTAKSKVGAAVDPLDCTRHAIHNSVSIWAERGVAIQACPTFPLKYICVPRQHRCSELATNLCGIALGVGLGVLEGEHTRN